MIYPKFNGVQFDVELIEREFSICDIRIDLLGIDDECNLFIIEIKKGEIDEKAYVQLLSYMNVVKNYFDNSDEKYNKIYGVLIGSSTNDRVRTCLSGSSVITSIEFQPSFSFDENEYSPNEDYYKRCFEENKTLLKIISDKNQEIKDLEEFEKNSEV